MNLLKASWRRRWRGSDMLKRRRLQAFGLHLMMAGALTACATSPRSPAQWPVLTGRLSLQVAAHAAEPVRGFSGQFDLRGSADAGALDVSGPLGAGLFRATWSSGHYRLDTGQQALEFNSLEDLAQASLGEALPLTALFDWLKARPWPGAPFASLGNGRPGFEQLGWHIETGDMPNGRLRAQRLQPPVIQLRIVLDSPSGS